MERYDRADLDMVANEEQRRDKNNQRWQAGSPL